MAANGRISQGLINTAPSALVLPPPQKALRLGIVKSLRLEFALTGTLVTVQELEVRGKNARITSGWRVKGPDDLFQALGPHQAALLKSCNGRLSPLAPTRLSPEARERGGVPQNAAYYALAYPANRASEVRKSLRLAKERWGGFLLMGGFWYFDAQRRLLQTNTFDSTERTGHVLSFCGPGGVTEAAAVSALEQQGRLQNVTADVLLQRGMERFAWVHASERPGGHALSRQFGYPLGALVFLMRSGGACFYALEPSQVAPPDAAADDSRANHGGGGGGGGGDAGPSESLMHEEDADGETAASPSLAGGPAKKSAPPSLAGGGGPGPKKALDSKATEIARRKNRKQERRREEEAAKRALLDLRHKFDADRRLMRREALQFVMHDVVHLAGQREAARQKPWYVLDPYGWLMTCVDMTSALALIFTVLVTPFEVAFLEPAHAWNDPLFLTNRAVDVFFIVELLLQFFLMYRREGSERGLTPDDDEWEKSLGKIGCRYLTGWFVIDLASILPSTFDFFLVAQLIDEDVDAAGAMAARPEGLRMIRTVRALRVIKLVRLVRTSRLASRIISKLSISYQVAQLCGLLFIVIISAHLIACAFGMIATVLSTNRLDTWLATHGLCWPGNSLSGPTVNKAECADAWTIYLQAFYFAMGTLVAYTDSPKEGPREPYYSDRASLSEWRPPEQWTVVGLLFIGACGWAYITARFVDMVSNGDPATTEFYQKMDLLNRFCSHFQIETSKRRRLREYMHEMRRELRDADECDRVFDLLSPHLLQDILWDVHGQWLVRMPFLRRYGKKKGHKAKSAGPPTISAVKRTDSHDQSLPERLSMGSFAAGPLDQVEYLDYRFMVQLARLMRADVFVPNEMLPRGRLYVINKGAVRNHKQILEPFTSFGMPDVMLSGDVVPRPDAFALNYVHTLSVRREELIGESHGLIHEFPDALKAIRYWCILQAVAEFVKRQVREVLEAQRLSEDREHARRYSDAPEEERTITRGSVKDLAKEHNTSTYDLLQNRWWIPPDERDVDHCDSASADSTHSEHEAPMAGPGPWRPRSPCCESSGPSAAVSAVQDRIAETATQIAIVEKEAAIAQAEAMANAPLAAEQHADLTAQNEQLERTLERTVTDARIELVGQAAVQHAELTGTLRAQNDCLLSEVAVLAEHAKLERQMTEQNNRVIGQAAVMQAELTGKLEAQNDHLRGEVAALRAELSDLRSTFSSDVHREVQRALAEPISELRDALRAVAAGSRPVAVAEGSRPLAVAEGSRPVAPPPPDHADPAPLPAPTPKNGARGATPKAELAVPPESDTPKTGQPSGSARPSDSSAPPSSTRTPVLSDARAERGKMVRL